MLRKSIEEGYGHVLSFFRKHTNSNYSSFNSFPQIYLPFFCATNTFFQTLLFNHIFSSISKPKPNTSLPFLKENCDHAREVGETGDRSSNSQRVCRRRTICSRFTTLTIVLSRSQNQNLKFFIFPIS